jgi:hypothetical protein
MNIFASTAFWIFVSFYAGLFLGFLWWGRKS